MRHESATVQAGKRRILVAMSGGVDSSLAAALLVEQGHEVIGVTLHLWDAGGADKVGRCCAPEDRDDARRTCELLGVAHYVLDERDAFRAHVVDPFVATNLAGRTPIPCVACNQQVKLARLYEIALHFGAEAVATGHYARVRSGPNGTELLRGRDLDKDQSYFLFGVPARVLARLVLPLGELHKPDARLEAKRLGLPNWNKPDSQELCFVPDGDVRGFVERHAAPGVADAAGDVIDEQGRVLGRHRGIAGFTVGQRRGLGIPGKEPRYVLRVLPETQQVVVGPVERTRLGALRAREVIWTAGVPEGPFDAAVRIRSRHTPAAAWIAPGPDSFEAHFRDPQPAIAPGQAAVIYRGDQVVGGGYIDA
jgi:tRNA-specific 2-thiouridylase